MGCRPEAETPPFIDARRTAPRCLLVTLQEEIGMSRFCFPHPKHAWMMGALAALTTFSMLGQEAIAAERIVLAEEFTATW